MTVAVVIPWRGGNPQREHHHRVIRDHLRTLLPDAHHLDADSGHQPFNRAASRNHGVRLAEQAGADVVVVCDADTLVQPDPLHEAIAAAGDGRLHLPYTRYRGLTREGTEAWLSNRPDIDSMPTEDETTWSTGGVLVIRTDAWWRAGGQDERFTGWGAEDSAYRIACDALLGPTVRHEGTIHHLWHPVVRTQDPLYPANMALAHRYDAAEGDPDAVRAIVGEHRALATTGAM